LLWGGQAVSQTGSQLTVLALPLVGITVRSASTVQAGLLSAAVTSAYLLFALPAGVVADRVSKRAVRGGLDVVGVRLRAGRHRPVSYQQATCPARLRGRVSAAQRWINWGHAAAGRSGRPGRSAACWACTSRCG
jgi:MFS family permease